jgi:hypothetical protein
MPVRFTSEQFATCDSIAAEQFYRDLHADMVTAFPDMEETRIAQYGALCRPACRQLGIETEQAITCFHILTLYREKLLSDHEGYADEHARYVRKYGSGNQVPVDMHAWLTACVA